MSDNQILNNALKILKNIFDKTNAKILTVSIYKDGFAVDIKDETRVHLSCGCVWAMADIDLKYSLENLILDFNKRTKVG